MKTGWLDMAEVGCACGVRFLVVVGTLLGRAPARFCLHFVALYYVLLHPRARRASRRWLGVVHGPERVTASMVYTHFLRFSQVVLDRLFLVRRQNWRFEIAIHGGEHLRAICASKRGTLLLGAHLGSFEAMRAQADLDRVSVNVVGHFMNARMINAALRRLDPSSRVRLIEIKPPGIEFILSVKECIDRGEHVALLGDRSDLGGVTVEVDFMGAPAPFPGGVYLLAAVLHCPVYLMFALYRDPNRYDLHCEPFAEEVVLPRHARVDGMREHAQRYADRLAHYARLAPDNWFNFFDFWSPRA